MPTGIVVDPNIVYVILLFGLWMGVTAAYIPGTGAAEMVSLVTSVVAILILASMPTNWLAVLVLVVGVSGFLVMPFINRRLALLAVGGLLLQAVGSLFLFNGESVSLPLIAGIVLLSLVYHRFLLLPILDRHQDAPPLPEDEALIGSPGWVVKPTNPIGAVRALGETWTARSDSPLEAGTEVVVVGREGLVLIVESVKRKREQLAARTEEAQEIEL